MQNGTSLRPMKQEICVIGLLVLWFFIHIAGNIEKSRKPLTKSGKSDIIFVLMYSYCQGTYNIIQIMLLSLDTLVYIFLSYCGVNIPQWGMGIRYGGVTHERTGRERN